MQSGSLVIVLMTYGICHMTIDCLQRFIASISHCRATTLSGYALAQSKSCRIQLYLNQTGQEEKIRSSLLSERLDNERLCTTSMRDVTRHRQ